MKRLIIVLFVVGVLVGTAYGAAAALNVNGGVIQVGKDTTLACQTSAPVSVGWRTAAGGGGDARIFGLELSGFDSACDGQYVLAYLLDNTGNFPSTAGMWRASATISGGAVVVDEYYVGGGPPNWHAASMGEGPLASLIDQVHIIVKSAFVSSDAPGP